MSGGCAGSLSGLTPPARSFCHAPAVDKDECFFPGNKSGKRIKPPGRGPFDHKTGILCRRRGRDGDERRGLRPAESHARISSGFPTVAESPIRCTGPLAIRSSRSRRILTWTPRSDSTNAWSSSTMTYFRFKIGAMPLFVQEHFERLGRDQRELRGFVRLSPPVPFRDIPMPFCNGKTGRPAERGDAFLLVVDERL